MMIIKKYIDLDGVILDTLPWVFKEWMQMPDYKHKSIIQMHKYLENKNWNELLPKSAIINDAIKILNSINDSDVAILTKVHSLENEGKAKIKFLRSLGIKQEIILVPFSISKTDVVNAHGNILFDDTLSNLEQWQKEGGIALFFDSKGTNIDSYNIKNDKFKKIDDLNFLFSSKK